MRRPDQNKAVAVVACTTWHDVNVSKKKLQPTVVVDLTAARTMEKALADVVVAVNYAKSFALRTQIVPSVPLSLLDVGIIVVALYIGTFVVSATWNALATLLRTVTAKSLRSYGKWAVVTGATDVRHYSMIYVPLRQLLAFDDAGAACPWSFQYTIVS